MSEWGVLISTILVISVNTAKSGDLLPPDKNPVEVGRKVPDLVRFILEIFDSEPISKRHYDHIAPLDGITMGLGHYPQAEIGDFFQALHNDNDGKTFKVFIERLNEYLQTDEGAWRALQVKANVATASLSQEVARDAIKGTILNKEFMKRYEKNCDTQKCKPDEPNFYHEQERWFVPSMRYVLRDSVLVDWQVRYWDDYLLTPSKAKAKQAGLASIAGVIGVASAESHAKSWATYIAGAKERGFISNDKARLRWDWNKHPFINNPTAEQLESWRLLAMWQYYCSKEGKLRNRSRAYFVKYLADIWKLPTSLGNSERNIDPRNYNPSYVKMKE